jgi:hypothetical protein
MELRMLKDVNVPYAVNLSFMEGVKIENYADALYFNGRDHQKDAE